MGEFSKGTELYFYKINASLKMLTILKPLYSCNIVHALGYI